MPARGPFVAVLVVAPEWTVQVNPAFDGVEFIRRELHGLSWFWSFNTVNSRLLRVPKRSLTCKSAGGSEYAPEQRILVGRQSERSSP